MVKEKFETARQEKSYIVLSLLFADGLAQNRRRFLPVRIMGYNSIHFSQMFWDKRGCPTRSPAVRNYKTEAGSLVSC
jgi:hypothetical protein